LTVVNNFFSDYSRITKFLTDRVNAFDGEALKHRLNQRPQNSALQSAAKVKEKLSILKKQNKSEGIDVSVQLWMYPESKNGAAKKVSGDFYSSSLRILTCIIFPRLSCHPFLLILTAAGAPTICLMNYYRRFKSHMNAAPHTSCGSLWM
jgi:hypothetical protein